MKFGDTPVADAEGAILAHSVRLADKTAFKKGRVLSADDVAALIAAGVATVIAARLEPGDVGEDEAAARIAAACTGEKISSSAAFTGRCNLFAEAAGVLVVDHDRLDQINLVDEALTIATIPPYSLVQPRDMLATVKVIPFAAPEALVAECAGAASGGAGAGPLMRVATLKPRRAGLILSTRPGMKESVLERTVDVTRARIEALGGTLDAASVLRCNHDRAEVAAALDRLLGVGCDLLMVSGASAIVDRRDIIPAAIEQVGGEIDHFGMPVDPGNLMLIGHKGGAALLGLPGCARSPSFNGFDWILQRLFAGLSVGPEEIRRMGAGGLLKEIASRPLPRATAVEAEGDSARPPAREARVAAIVLAAGQSRRMGSVNKLLADIDGQPMLTRVADAAIASRADPVLVVTGHEADRVSAALGDRQVRLVHNPDYAKGLSTSLRRGLAALDDDVEGVVVCLGDMPGVTGGQIDKLIAAFDPLEGRAICVPTFNGKQGNPVLWQRRYFAEMAQVAGDVGARHLIGEHADHVCEVAMGDDGVLMDLDTPAALASHRAGTKASEA